MFSCIFPFLSLFCNLPAANTIFPPRNTACISAAMDARISYVGWVGGISSSLFLSSLSPALFFLYLFREYILTV